MINKKRFIWETALIVLLFVMMFSISVTHLLYFIVFYIICGMFVGYEIRDEEWTVILVGILLWYPIFVIAYVELVRSLIE